MGLGGRNANQHDTVATQKIAVVSEDYADFTVGQHVMTSDGFPGVVASIEDGPFPGTESYVVTLDNGLGGGEYRTGQLAEISTVTAAGSHEGLASQDYPELSDILFLRPDIATEH